jgi:hypothetical protein
MDTVARSQGRHGHHELFGDGSATKGAISTLKIDAVCGVLSTVELIKFLCGRQIRVIPAV